VPVAIASGKVTNIGAYASTQHHFNGTIDEVMVWNTPLSGATISGIYAAAYASDSYLYSTPTDPTPVQSHYVSIPTLASGAHFAVTSVDTSGNSAQSADQVVPTVVAGDLQAMINEATAGSTLNVTGYTFAAGSGITVNKALTIIGGTLTSGANIRAITISASNVTLNGMTITGPQHEDINSHTQERGIIIQTALSNITLTNLTISNFGMAGMWLDRVTNLTITYCDISDCGYAGIMVLSGTGGLIQYNTVTGIGESFYTGGSRYPAIGDAGSNAYGIALSQLLSPSLESTGFLVDNNIVDSVPPWHAFDTHGGDDITFSNNTSKQSRCAYYITAGTSGSRNTHVTDNRAESYTQPAGASSPASVIAVAFIGSTDCSATGNALDDGYPDYNDYPDPGDDRVLNYQDGNVRLTVSGNTLIT